MIIEVFIWSVSLIGAAIETIIAYLVPDAWLDEFRAMVAEYGIGTVGALGQFFNQGSLEVLVGLIGFALVVFAVRSTMLAVRVVRSWMH